MKQNSGSETHIVNILCVSAALTVRFLTRRFIGEYGDMGESLVCRPHMESISGPQMFESVSVFAESVYSRMERIHGQEICINIWDSQVNSPDIHTHTVHI